jgi:flagellar motor switch protein FliN/FliY
VLPKNKPPLAGLARGTVMTGVSYVDGVTGANIFVLTPAGARALATAMGVPPPDPDDDFGPIQLTELELSAVAEAANQMMAAAASAIGVVLGQEIDISPPDTRMVDEPEAVTEAYGTAPHAASTTFLISGESCRLIQLVPSAFVARMVRAIDEQRMEQNARDGAPTVGHGHGGDPQAGDTVGLEEALSGINLRVWAELGRTSLPLGNALSLPQGAVVDLDRAADAPVELFVNGLRFAEGHLLVTDDGEWAVCIDQLGGRRSPGPNELLVSQASNQPTDKGALL